MSASAAVVNVGQPLLQSPAVARALTRLDDLVNDLEAWERGIRPSWAGCGDHDEDLCDAEINEQLGLALVIERRALLEAVTDDVDAAEGMAGE